jgi:DNA-binding transcriptional regulator of glucitol operon
MESPAADDAADGAVQAPAEPAWRFALQPRWLLWHLTMVAAFCGMLWMGNWQLQRATGGNGLSWAYVFEWPLFAAFAVVFWSKTIRDEYRIRAGKIVDPKRIRDLEAAAAEARMLSMIDPNRPKAITAGSGAAELGISQADDWNQPWADDEPEDPELADYNAYLARLHLKGK